MFSTELLVVFLPAFHIKYSIAYEAVRHFPFVLYDLDSV